ncbi:MAG: hypothetical protein CL675_07400 [Bdellovibrionaceae bacterium]|nr:hypothetical protein [Pseudobdellovibrionaceae bacterium]
MRQTALDLFNTTYRTFVGLWILCAVTIAGPVLGFAQTSIDGMNISSNELIREGNKKVILKGDIQVSFADQHVSCDYAEIDLEAETVVGKGNVILDTPEAHAEAEEIIYYYKKKTGKLYNGFVKSGQVVIEGSLIEKLSDDDYLAFDAKYTACDTCPPAWSFTGKRIEAELGGYAYIKNPIFRIADFPVFYLPGIVVPLRSNRQSGFLVPTLGFSSRGGTVITSNYFWAIDESRDATFGIRNYSARGVMARGEYRYVLSKYSKGRLNTSIIRDERFTDNFIDTEDRNDRWFMDYDHYFDLPEGYVQRAQIKRISDRRYVRDFTDEIAGNGDPALENRVNLTKNWDSGSLTIEADYYYNLLRSNPTRSNDDAVHRFPSITYSLAQQEIGKSGVYYKVDANYTNFTRRGFGYDDAFDGSACSDTSLTSGDSEVIALCESRIGQILHPELFNSEDCTTSTFEGTTSKAACQTFVSNVNLERDGEFEPADVEVDDRIIRDVARTGQRLDIAQTLSYPVRFGNILEALPVLTYRDTRYNFSVENPDQNFDRNANRQYLEASLRLGTELSYVFGGDDSDKKSGEKYLHRIVPTVTYQQIPWANRPDHAFFGDFNFQPLDREDDPVSESDFQSGSKIQFDYEDRLFDKRLVTLGVNNKIIKKEWINGKARYRNLLNFQLYQTYDLREAQSSDDPQPWSSLRSQFNLALDRFEFNSTLVYNPYARIVNSNSSVLFKNLTGDYFSLGFSQVRVIDENNEPVGDTTTNIGLGFRYRSRYADLLSNFNFNPDAEEFNESLTNWRYSVLFKPPGRCWSIGVAQSGVLGGDQKIDFTYNFEFGGDGQGKTLL